MLYHPEHEDSVEGPELERVSHKITVDGREIRSEEKVYIVLNKPEGVITTAKDTHGRKTVVDMVSGFDKRLFPVGRLDKDSTGALILTNDGELAYRLTHPKFGVDKVYKAAISGHIDRSGIARLEKGILIEGKKTSPCKVKVLKENEEGTDLEITLHEGRKRQIRKMLKTAGHPVLKLHRLRYNNLGLGNLRPGQWRKLSEKEIKGLC